ncbi:hypothetical protein J3R30DRAFT_3697976 [Lentinula aciculospora]|uniref:G1/S-specific cyclin pas1 n=1 Tax=Lentinula aciculospora TaxID=153920 RepID=A0A9W9AJG3_9AGAR|nr:hypothetical protein J3R30DRAFT_3697976 [Lentinula aciculospora]
MCSIHSLAHRAPASRTRVRWQPYGALPASASVPTPSSSNSPSSSTHSSSPFSSAPSSPVSADAEPPKQHTQSTPQPQRDAQPRDKNKYALGLVDQAVKSLCEIWRPQDIPQVFLTTSRAAVPATGPPINQSISKRNRCFSSSSPTQAPPTSLFATGIHTECGTPPGTSNLVPMKGFVHEVLRRSRTSGSVLQTALCYLEAIRPRIPEIAYSSESFKGETELADRITVATEEELAREAEFCIGTDTIIINESNDSMDTIRITDSYSGSTAVSSGIIEDGESTLKKSKGPSPALAPLPLLPSPLLCPRRAFLASLILASKFTQDKCYSNRAWAKLSGLPPREVGRCERALGDALDWRLWVGKSSSQSQTTSVISPTGSSNTRPLARCRSENSISYGTTDAGGFLHGTDNRPISPSASVVCRPREAVTPESSRIAGLRRAVTLPAEAFAFSGDSDKQFIASCGNAVTRWIQHSDSNKGQIGDVDMHPPSVIASVEHGTRSIHTLNADMYVSDTSPPTPGLTYSPSSTESSSGDRTIQMPCFLDDKNMAMGDGFTPMVGLSGSSSESWSWLDQSPTGPMVGHTIIPKQHPAPFPVSAADAAFDFEQGKLVPNIPLNATFPYFASGEVMLRSMYQVE